MRRQDKSVHELPSFARYLNKVFDFRATAATLTDSRGAPEIPPSAVFLAAFHGFAFRLPSFQQLEAELTETALQQRIGAGRAFRDDVLRYSLSGFHLEGLERMLTGINRTLKRILDGDGRREDVHGPVGERIEDAFGRAFAAHHVTVDAGHSQGRPAHHSGNSHGNRGSDRRDTRRPAAGSRDDSRRDDARRSAGSGDRAQGQQRGRSR